MTTVMTFPRTRPMQSALMGVQQTTARQTGGIDISSLMNLMLPVMIIGMMGKMMSGMMGSSKQLETAESHLADAQAAGQPRQK